MTVYIALDDDDDLGLTSLSTLFKSYQEDGTVIMKGSEGLYSLEPILPPAGFKPRISLFKLGSANQKLL